MHNVKPAVDTTRMTPTELEALLALRQAAQELPTEMRLDPDEEGNWVHPGVIRSWEEGTTQYSIGVFNDAIQLFVIDSADYWHKQRVFKISTDIEAIWPDADFARFMQAHQIYDEQRLDAVLMQHFMDLIDYD